jgi:hypothetical protein
MHGTDELRKHHAHRERPRDTRSPLCEMPKTDRETESRPRLLRAERANGDRVSFRRDKSVLILGAMMVASRLNTASHRNALAHR